MKDVPKSVTLNTGEQGEIQPIIDDFFKDAADYISENYDVGRLERRIESGELAFSPSVVTDNRVTYLSYDKYIVACVFATRTDLNYVHYSFFRDLGNLAD